ncbi:MAG: diacylglycerol kinase family lipid kinase [Clostridia bacterium]|nr:diacylglycerol kinase family lipid kinase [Clostridia bacterium]
MKKVFLIINPHSGKLKNKSVLFDIINIMSENNCEVTIRFTSKPGDAKTFAKEACESKLYDSIVCSGGDGTLNETVSGTILSGCPLPIGYIPAGTTNDYARTLGITSETYKAANLSVTGKVATIDVGVINGVHFNYIASFGAFTSVSYNAPRSLKKHLGHMAYILAGIKDITNIKSIPVKLESYDKKVEGDFIFGAITNTTSIGGIVHLNDALVGFNDGEFEVCLVRKPKNPVEIVKVIKAALSSDFDNENFVFFKTDKVTINLPDNVDWSIDGEKFPGSEIVNIEVLPGAAKLIL